MKKIYKCFLSGVAAIALSSSILLDLPKEIFPTFPDIVNTLKVFATDEIASGICGENLTWTIDANGVLTIDGTGDMYTYEYTSDTAKQPTYSAYDSVITKVVVGENVASLSPYAFICYYSVNYTKLTEVEIKSTLMTEIPSYCFSGCKSLLTVQLPEQITFIDSNSFSSCPITTINMPAQLKKIGAWAFYQSQFTELDFPYGLEEISRAAFMYSKIERVVLPETVKTIAMEAFQYSKVKELQLHDKGLSIGQRAFANSNIVELHLPANIVLEYDPSTGTGCNFSSSSIKKLYIEEGVNAVGGAVFSSCQQLEEIYFPSTIKTIGRSTFSGCINLKTAKMPDSISSIGERAFSGCANCQDFFNLNLPSNLKTLGSNAFSGTNVESIFIPKSTTDLEASWGWYEGNYRFTSAKFKEYIVDPDNPKFSSKNGVLYNKEQTQVIDYPSYKEDESYTFPSSVSVMSTTSEKNDIAYNKHLKTIIFPDDTAFTVISELNDTIEREYHNKTIETIILPKKDIKISNWAFSYLDSLKVIYIPSEITDLQGSILLDCPNAVIYCHSGSAAESYAKKYGYKYKLVSDVKIDNGYVVFPNEITLGGVKHITPEIIGDTDLSGKEISWNSDDNSVDILSYVNEKGTTRVNFVARELGEHTINIVIDGENHTFTFNVVKEKATGFIGNYIKSNVDDNGVFVPLETNGKLYDDSVYVNELRYWIEQLGYADLFSNYLLEHTYEDLLSLEVAMPIKDSNGDEYLWTNTDVTVRDMMTYIIFMNDNKSYLENMEKELNDTTDYLYQSRVYSLNYQSAYDYLMNLYIANCELESDLTGNEVMMKYLSVIAYGIIATENNTTNSKTYEYIQKFDKLQIDDVANQESDFLGFIISGGDTNELAYSIQNDVSKAKEVIDDGYTVINAIKTIYDYETGKTTQERMLLDLVLDSYLPTYTDKLEKGKYISQEYIDYCKNTNEFIGISKSTITAIASMYTKPTGLLIGLPVKLNMKYIKQVKGVFEDAEKQDAGWYILTMYTFNNDENKLGAYIDSETFKIRSLLESNLNFSTNTAIENGIMEDYESKYALGDGSFATLPSDSKILVLFKAAQTANLVKQTNTEAKAEELLQHMLAQIGQDNFQEERVTFPTAQNEITYGQSLSEVKLPYGWQWADEAIIPDVQNNGFESYTIVTDYDNFDYNKLTGFTYDESAHRLSCTVTVTVNKAIPIVTAPTAIAITYGQTLSDSTLSDTNWSWVDETIIPTVQNSGYAAKTTVDDSNYDYIGVEGYDSTNHTVTRTIPVTVTLAPAMVLTAPSAIMNLVYDGNAKALVSAGTASGGTMVYSFDRVSFSETIPTATEAGTYTVYYKALGDENNSDSEVGQVSVTIDTPAEIITAITVSESAVAVTYGYEGTTITTRVENVAFTDVTVEMVEWMKNSNIRLVIDFVNYSTEGNDIIILTSAQMRAIEYVLAHDLGM